VRVHSIADVASAVRGRRKDLGLSQSALADQTGISRKWISEFEAGKATAEFAHVIRVIEGLGLQLELDIESSARGGATSSKTSPATETLRTTPSVDLDALLEEYRKE
jgi:HTH-type transcriptional regulator / antitoxin HipB